MIPYGRQTIDEDDLASVPKVLESDWLTQGPTVQNFEEKVSNIPMQGMLSRRIVRRQLSMLLVKRWS